LHRKEKNALPFHNSIRPAVEIECTIEVSDFPGSASTERDR
jgi:hypothetical protein